MPALVSSGNKTIHVIIVVPRAPRHLKKKAGRGLHENKASTTSYQLKIWGEQPLEVTIKHLYTDSMQSNSYTDCKAARLLNSYTLVTQALLPPATGDNTPKRGSSSGILSKCLIRFYSWQFCWQWKDAYTQLQFHTSKKFHTNKFHKNKKFHRRS